MSEKKLDLILEKLDNHGKLITQQGDMMVQLLQIVGATNNKVANLEKSVDDLKSDVSELKTNVTDLKETVDTIVDTQNEQNLILDTLSRNSVKHESEIRKIKSIK